jgi:hypothetical protein
VRTPPEPPVGPAAAVPVMGRAVKVATAARKVRRGGAVVAAAVIVAEAARSGSWWMVAGVAGAGVVTVGLVTIVRRFVPDRTAARLLAHAREAGQLGGAIDATAVQVWPLRAASGAVDRKLLRQVYRAVVVVHPDRLVIWREGWPDEVLRLSEVGEVVFERLPVPAAGSRVYLALDQGTVYHFFVRDPDRLAGAVRAAGVLVSGA